MEIRLNIKTKEPLTEVERETLESNLWSLMNEVRPDLVNEGIDTFIDGVEVMAFDTESSPAGKIYTYSSGFDEDGKPYMAASVIDK
ncbi:hypothetical protein [Bacillus mycoides]|uniref:hypothetical protein n=1 Tax=Bacillus mycoides TaxID=1405 RepID=UPI003A808A99